MPSIGSLRMSRIYATIHVRRAIEEACTAGTSPLTLFIDFSRPCAERRTMRRRRWWCRYCSIDQGRVGSGSPHPPRVARDAGATRAAAPVLLLKLLATVGGHSAEEENDVVGCKAVKAAVVLRHRCCSVYLRHRGELA